MPGEPQQTPREKALDVFGKTKAFFCDDLKTPGWVATPLAGIAALIEFAGAWLLPAILNLYIGLFGQFFDALLEGINEARQEGDETITGLSVDVLNELFGGKLSKDDIPTGVGQGQHVERARIVGQKFRDSLLAEFVPSGGITPESGYTAAATFSGFAVNFATATAFVAIFADALSFGHFEQFRELGVEATRNLGLGRMQARSWRAIIDEIINKPAQRYILRQYRTTIPNEAQIVQLQNAGLISSDLAATWLSWLGYPDSLMGPLFELLQKRIPDSSVERLLRWNVIQLPDALSYLQAQGFSKDHAILILADLDLARADRWQDESIRVALDAYVHRVLDVEAWTSFVNALNAGEGEKRMLAGLGDWKRNLPHKFVSEGQAERLLTENILDLDSFSQHLTAEGYPPDDISALEVWALIRQGRLDEARKAAEYRWKQAVAKAEAKGLPPPPKPPIVSNP
jgi:hypothetical protein